jgi:hypothetical protein
MENESVLKELRETAQKIQSSVMPKSVTPEMVGGSLVNIVEILSYMIPALENKYSMNRIDSIITDDAQIPNLETDSIFFYGNAFYVKNEKGYEYFLKYNHVLNDEQIAKPGIYILHQHPLTQNSCERICICNNEFEIVEKVLKCHAEIFDLQEWVNKVYAPCTLDVQMTDKAVEPFDPSKTSYFTNAATANYNVIKACMDRSDEEVVLMNMRLLDNAENVIATFPVSVFDVGEDTPDYQLRGVFSYRGKIWNMYVDITQDGSDITVELVDLCSVATDEDVDEVADFIFGRYGQEVISPSNPEDSAGQPEGYGCDCGCLEVATEVDIEDIAKEVLDLML